MKHHNIQKLVKTFVETSVSGEFISSELTNSDIIRKAERENKLQRYNEDIYFCCYKTTFEEKDGVLLLCAFRLPGPSTGSSAASEMVFDMLGMIEKRLMPIQNTYYVREIDSNDKSIGILRVIKVINDNGEF